MKTNYTELGKESMKKLRTATNNAPIIQEKLVQDLLWENRHTQYGKKYNFETIHTIEEYQDRLPVTTYEDYSGYIQKMIQGEKGQLTDKDPVYYAISSGSTGKPKYLPVAEADMMMHYTYVYGAVFGMVQEYYEERGETDFFGKIFQTGEFFKTYMENGVMNGIRSSSLYQWMDQENTFDCSDYTAVREIIFPDKLDDLIYIKVRFALAERDVRCIHGVFIHRVVGVLHYIEKNWDLLLRDMESGTVDDSIALSEEWREKVNKWLLPNPERARELRNISREHFSEKLITKIWENVKYILVIGGSTFSNYMEELHKYAGEVPVHYFAYAATEGIFGVARQVNEADAYILLPESGLFEFKPEHQSDNDNKRPLLMKDVKKGEKYEIIFTNHSGLYRYALYDVVEVVDFYGSAPVIRFCYRRNQILSIVDEKTNTEQLERAMKLFEQKTNLQVVGYCAQEDYSMHSKHYLVYVECAGKLPENADAIMDACLCESSFDYQGCRRMGDIDPLHMVHLPEGIFASYDKSLAKQGHEMGQSKPLRILNTEEKKKFFAEEYKKGMGRL